AGADRMQTGMSQSFGKNMGRAAFVKPGQTIFILGIKSSKQEVRARNLIRAAKSRLPCKVTTKTIRLPL
ncbi:ribosomal protein L16, partial [Candidatus Pacearchaeota archaeon]|nr:ribosomal protein L16 [Candidatus Pacearchaeota archaeon]